MSVNRLLKFEIFPARLDKYPLDWYKIFARSAPLMLEIGCGNGEFLVNRALQNPESNFLGIELSLESGIRIQSRIYKNNLKNVRVVRGDARFVLRELFPDESIHGVIINFPDPWPKEKHRKHRIIIPKFVSTLAAVLESKGFFRLVTDQQWYAEESSHLFQTCGYFEVEGIKKNPPRKVTTKYERKWRSSGIDIFSFRAVKTKFHKVERILEDRKMPHVTLNKEIQPDEIFKLRGYVHQAGTMVFKIKEIFTNPQNQSYLLRAVAKDDDYTQGFFILISPRKNGYIIRLDPNQQPYRTPAVKEAIHKIGSVLREE